MSRMDLLESMKRIQEVDALNVERRIIIYGH